VEQAVDAAEERHRVEIFAAAVLVGQPVLARVIKVEHGRDGVHAEAVDVVLLDPEKGVGAEEGGDLGALGVEGEGAPLVVLAAARIGVLVEAGAVETREAVGVFREMRGHPVHDDAEAGAVGGIDEVAKIVGRAETRGGREKAGDLITPGAVEGMLGDGQQLKVRVAHFADVGDELVGDLAVGVPDVVLGVVRRGRAAP
jgi:hypothetical protein